MSHTSPRRRFAGRAMLGLGLLALPLTATVTFAASDDVPAVPEPPAPPAPPAPPEAPTPPEAPEPPEATTPPEPPRVVIIKSADGEVEVEGEGDAEVIERVIRDEDGKEKRIRMVFRSGPGERAAREGASEAERAARKAEAEAMMSSLKVWTAEVDRARAEIPRAIEIAIAEAEAARGEAGAQVIVRRGCRPGGEEVTETAGKDGTRIVTICQARIVSSARKGLEEARDEIARDKDIPDDTRKEMLRHLDRAIARWDEKEG